MGVKQTIIMRSDLGMRKGKMIAQGAHAAMAFLTNRIRNAWEENYPPQFNVIEQEWIEGSFRKICLQVDSEKELLDIYEKAKKAGLEAHLITDSGLTEFHGVPTNTCIALGPDEDEKIDLITAGLRLY